MIRHLDWPPSPACEQSSRLFSSIHLNSEASTAKHMWIAWSQAGLCSSHQLSLSRVRQNAMRLTCEGYWVWIGWGPEVPENCVVPARYNNPAFLPAALRHPRELALAKVGILDNHCVLCLQPQEARLWSLVPHSASEAVCFPLVFVLCTTASM